MTQEDEELLKDLCSRLPYGVKCQWGTYYKGILIDVCKCKTKDDFVYWDCYFEECGDDVPIEIVKPYLRSMSSMTKEEDEEYRKTKIRVAVQWDDYGNPIGFEFISTFKTFDWLNSHHFDYRGLIKKGLAIKATKEMYETN